MVFNLQLSQEEVQVIINALAELPLKVSMNTFGVVQRQVQEQQKNAETASSNS